MFSWKNGEIITALLKDYEKLVFGIATKGTQLQCRFKHPVKRAHGETADNTLSGYVLVTNVGDLTECQPRRFRLVQTELLQEFNKLGVAGGSLSVSLFLPLSNITNK